MKSYCLISYPEVRIIFNEEISDQISSSQGCACGSELKLVVLGKNKCYWTAKRKILLKKNT